MRKHDIGQTSGGRGAFTRRSAGGSGGRGLGGTLERVVVASSSARNLPRGGEENSAGGFDVTRRRGARTPLVVECAA